MRVFLLLMRAVPQVLVWSSQVLKDSSVVPGSVKGLTSHQLEELNCHVILGNTYHLENRPTSELVAKLGGLHSFVNWKRGMLTDSGGFQVYLAESGHVARLH